MTQYSFTTTWHIGAPVERVWEAIKDVGRWPDWWRYVEHATRLAPGDERGVGAVWRLEWGTALPYRLVFEARTTRVDAPHTFEAAATGELSGTGRWALTRSGVGEGETLVRYDWDVRTSKVWMNALAPVARPLFAWNHDVLMEEGGRGLARHLGVALLDASPRPRPLLAHMGGPLVAATGVLGGLALLTFRAVRRISRARP
jgi:uncharacterized protein YndB with AHSA1/START domain